MEEKAPTHNERVLAGALMIILSTKAMDSPGNTTSTIIPSAGTMPHKPNLMEIARIGYQMMGIDARSFLRTGASYDTVLEPAIYTLYEKFAIVEQVMNS